MSAQTSRTSLTASGSVGVFVLHIGLWEEVTSLRLRNTCRGEVNLLHAARGWVIARINGPLCSFGSCLCGACCVKLQVSPRWWILSACVCVPTNKLACLKFRTVPRKVETLWGRKEGFEFEGLRSSQEILQKNQGRLPLLGQFYPSQNCMWVRHSKVHNCSYAYMRPGFMFSCGGQDCTALFNT